MTRVLAIASATVSEVIRHRILYLLAIFAIALIVGSRLLSYLTVGDDIKIIKDVSLTAINFFGLAVVLFVGVGILFREMERRTVQTTLAAPVARWEYLIGKYFGLAAGITLNTVLMGAVLVVLLMLRQEFDPKILFALLMIWVELMFLTAAAVFYSSFATPIFAALFTAATYLVGHLAWSLQLLANKVPEGGARSLIEAIYFILPDLQYGDIRKLAVGGFDIPLDKVVLATAWEFSYAGILLVIACLAFRRRDLV